MKDLVILMGNYRNKNLFTNTLSEKSSISKKLMDLIKKLIHNQNYTLFIYVFYIGMTSPDPLCITSPFELETIPFHQNLD